VRLHHIAERALEWWASIEHSHVEASINGSKTNLMKLPPPQSGHLNRAFNLLAGGSVPTGNS
jgi:hypothetical protein